jgi:AcrR family transcriptional regulator
MQMCSVRGHRRTQSQRRADTRHRLLVAAAELFAERGFDGVSVDEVALRAGRTSGAVYDHFGSKQGLLLGLLAEWLEGSSTMIGAAVGESADLGRHLEAIWSGFTAHLDAGASTWVLLEHELLLRAARDPAVQAPLAERWRTIRERIAAGLGERGHGAASADQGFATLVVALLLGLELQRRIDPDAVPDDVARAGLRALSALVADSADAPRSGARTEDTQP